MSFFSLLITEKNGGKIYVCIIMEENPVKYTYTLR